MSTAVIFSFLLFGCEVRVQTQDLDSIKIGVQSDLLSFDPFSFQALGESYVIDALHDRLLRFDGGVLSSDLPGVNFHFVENSLVIYGLSKSTSEKIKSIFFKSKSSTLWKDVFKPFSFKETLNSSGVFKITYSDSKNFISNLKTISSLLLLKGGKHGAYKVESFKKGVSLKLERNPLWKGEGKRAERLFVKRLKSLSEGLKAVSYGDLDVLLPSSPLGKNELSPYNNLDAVYESDKIQKLRLYSKFNVDSPIVKTFCGIKHEVLKVLDKSWSLTKDLCAVEKERTTKPKDLAVVLGSRYGLPILDLLSQRYFKSSGVKIRYDVLDALELSQALKSGSYDQYLSLDIESPSMPVPYDSFHSRGRFNTFNIKDKVLDDLLLSAAEALNLKDFERIESKSRARLKAVTPVVFEYSRPHVSYFKQKNSRVKSVKSSKTLMKFQK